MTYLLFSVLGGSYDINQALNTHIVLEIFFGGGGGVLTQLFIESCSVVPCSQIFLLQHDTNTNINIQCKFLFPIRILRTSQ